MQVKKYLTFASTYTFSPLAPSQYDLMAYTLHLKDTLSTPGAVMNYLSGARTWVLLLTGDPQAFDGHQLALMKKGVQKMSTHAPHQAPPLTPKDILGVVAQFKKAGPEAAVLTAALLIGYNTLLRQGNLLQTTSHNDPGHTLKAQDVIKTPTGLLVVVNSTKTRWRRDQRYTITLQESIGSNACPVAAWTRYTTIQRPPLAGPAFILRGGSPLQPRTLLSALRAALHSLQFTKPEAYTLHSLRRGGAQAIAAAGGTLQQIMDIGAWTSSAVHLYVPRDLVTSGPRTLPKIG